jgi:NAD(P)-dependent dehydrogenase (short-subunit alcohol dehydrogenase family)
MSTVLITGAARGLGLEFTRQYADKRWKVHACARAPEKLAGLQGDIHRHRLEVTDYKAVKALATELAGEAIDVLICNAGVGGGREDGEGQDLGSFDPAAWRKIFEINTLAPLMMAEAFAEHVARSQQKKLIAITSILGSLANNAGGRYAYRSSKTALNMEWSCLAKDLAGRGVICVALHPGWVQTDMGGAGAALTIEQSVPPMVKTIEGLKASDNGRYLQWDGGELPW